MSIRRHLACLTSVIALCGLTATAHAQHPILPMCSDDPSYKLPPCKAPANQPPQPAIPPSTVEQQFPFPGSDAPTGQTSTPTPSAAPSPADQFPFPGDAATPATKPAQTAPATPAQQFPFPGDEPPASATRPAPASGTGSTPANSPASQFPFPGEPPKTANDPTLPADSHYRQGSSTPDDPNSSSSSSSSASSADDDPNLKDPNLKDSDLKDIGSEGSTKAQRRRLPKVEDMGAREDEDIKVAKFYNSTGNFLGAYLRAKDAIKIDPTDEDAAFYLAIDAEKLSKRDEAIAAYKEYLKLAPDGDKAKQVQRSLAMLQETAARK